MKTSNRLTLVFLLTLALFLIASARGANAACTTPTGVSLTTTFTTGPIFHFSIVDPTRNNQTVTHDAGPFGMCATAQAYDRFGVYTNCNPVGGGKDVFYVAYDVALGQWVPTQHLIGLSNLSIAIGTSATTAGVAGYNLNNAGAITIGYAIYNPKTHIWAEGSDSAGSLSGSGGPTFVNFGVDFQMSFSTQHRRFNGSAWGPGQNSSPLAATYVNPTSGSPTLNVCLANNSVATTSYSWTFGDGGMSTSDSVQHGYTTPDLFTWNFGASGPGGGPDTATGTIKTDFAAPTNGMVSINGGASCTNTNAVNLTISAMDNSGTVTEMQISNESPGTGSWEPYATSKMWSLQNTTGTRTVWIAFKDRAGNISSNGPNDTITFDNTPAPTAGNDGPKCAGQTLALTASFISGATYAWTGPNGFTSSQQNPSISGATPAATGIYSVTATVNGCPTPAGMTMATVTTAPSTPTAGNNGPICVGQTLNLTASFVSGATYAWTGPNGFTSTQQNPSISNATAAANGMYSVTATAGGCTSSAGTTSATVNGDPTAPTVTAPAAATVTQSTCS